ncbi:hypothetical protein Tsubulata_035532 [Turnera subulata]|uniref:PHD-type domain-containing protein n=1 Tax=Turnera subulata TaxID=218843 RepID=A0A9Q0F2J1_9ROSI|nr:hypothetical protein Tsubulata_035532 [Turnera subulata]
MTGEEGSINAVCSNGEAQCLNGEAVNGFADDGHEGSSGASEGFRTYKRRKQARSSLDSKNQDHGRGSAEAASNLADSTNFCSRDSLPGNHVSSSGVSLRKWRKFVLQQMYDSLDDDDHGRGIRGCIEDALLMTESDACHEDNHKSSSQTGWLHYGSCYAAKDRVVISNGFCSTSHCHTVTDMCRQAFLDIILSEKFTSLCKLLFENFKEIQTDSILSLSLLNRRMKEGAYESSPTLFHEDIEQFWRKLLGFGTELITLARSLSDVSRTCYNERVGTSVPSKLEDEKHKILNSFAPKWLCTQETDSQGKPAQTEACSVYRVRTCRHCGNKAEERKFLVCASCEEMYHVSCINPVCREIPPKNWYCAHCSATGMGCPHENCVVCERLNAAKILSNQAGSEIGRTNNEMLNEFEETSNYNTDDWDKLPVGCKKECSCKLCGTTMEDGDKAKICFHSFCPFKYYHMRCLTSKELKSYGPHWYCPSCLCRTCLTDKDDGEIVLCDGCDHAYHIYCLSPPLTEVPEEDEKWFCKHCDVKIQKIGRAKKEYERHKNKLSRESLAVKSSSEDLDENLYGKHRGESDIGREGMDILLTAALQM